MSETRKGWVGKATNTSISSDEGFPFQLVVPRRFGAPTWRTSLLLAFTLGCLGTASAAIADDAIPSVTLPCANCTTLAEMRTTAHTYFHQWKNATPSGKRVRPCVWTVLVWNTQLGEPVEYYQEYPNCTVAVVVSTTYPLTGTFEFARIDDGVVTTSPLHTPDDASLRDFDNYINARSHGMPPLVAPPDVVPSSDEDMQAFLGAKLITSPNLPNIANDFWHGLFNQGQFTRVK